MHAAMHDDAQPSNGWVGEGTKSSANAAITIDGFLL
jgi:hypothetical protein